MRDTKVIDIKVLCRACPVCGEQEGAILQSFQFAVPEHIRLPRQYDLVSCLKCGFSFADTDASQADYDHYYSEQSKYEDKVLSSGGTSTSWDQERFRELAEYLHLYLPDQETSFLDIGCANGGLLSALRKLGFTSLRGVDPSANCVANVIESDLVADKGGIFGLNDIHDKFGCIVLSHVLEHICDLRLAISLVSKKVQDGGCLYIEVPDATRYQDYYRVPNYYFDCEHINHFEPLSLENLLKQVGFVLLSILQKDIPVSAGNTRYPVISAIFKKSDSLSADNIICSSLKSQTGIEKYLELSSKDERADVIQTLVTKNEDIVVWGAGQYTMRLLSSTSLAQCLIKFFIDKDVKKQGTFIHSIPIRPPSALTGHRGPIVICSALHSTEILDEIESMGLQNHILVL